MRNKRRVASLLMMLGALAIFGIPGSVAYGATAMNTSLRYVLSNVNGTAYSNSSGTKFSYDNLTECQQAVSDLAASGVSAYCKDTQSSSTGGTCTGASTKLTGACRQACANGTEKPDGNCKSASGSQYAGQKCCVSVSPSGSSCTGSSGKAGSCYSVGNCPNGTVSDGPCGNGDSCCTVSSTVNAGNSTGTASSVAFSNPLQFSTVQDATATFLKAFQGIIVMLALIFLVLGGILYIASAGDSKKIEKAKGMITAAMIGLAIGVAAPSFLKEIGNVLGWGGSEVPSEVSGAKSATEVAQSVLDFLLSIVGLLAMIMLVIGGLMYFAAAGDEKRADTAKGIVKYSIMGIALAITSLIIVRTIAGLF